VVEDERLIADAVGEWLRREALAVDVVYDGDAALERFGVNDYDVLVLDRDLPGISGDEVCQAVVDSGAHTRILMLTAAAAVRERVAGLRLGADDYLTKDVSLHQIAARISALFRRIEALRKPGESESVIAQGPLRLEQERMRVTWNGEEVPLTVTEFWMVHTLVRFPGHVKNRDQLMREAQVVVDDATITSHIKRIRKKFLAIDAAFDAIDTVHGAGYRWKP
jgi:two-component system OmpR family response regulator